MAKKESIIKTKRKNPYADRIDRGILLLFASVMAWYYYSTPALLRIAVGCLTAVLAGLLASLLLKLIFKGRFTFDIFFVSGAGVCAALLMPATVSLPVLIVLTAVSVLAALLCPPVIFKNTLDRTAYRFSAAAVTAAFTGILPFVVGNPPVPKALVGAASPTITAPILQLLTARNGADLQTLGMANILTGNVAGPMGATCFVLMLASFVYIVIRKPKNAVMPLAYVLTIAVCAIFFPRAGLSAGYSLLCELAGGFALFTAVFILSEDRLQTKNIVTAALLGVAGGLVTMLMRYILPNTEPAGCAALMISIIVLAIRRSDYGKKPDKNVRGKRTFRMNNTQEDPDKSYMDSVAGQQTYTYQDAAPTFRRTGGEATEKSDES
ncbi:MAG: RnfABCDGE type electron transport complex subunit D [Clostridia bacterium]|nr:RnfABCDGE type electron transport complex subunit D [Clostridia bacterium]